MDFGLFTMFSTREGASQFHTFQEWFDLVQVAEDAGLDTLWLGESHFRPQRAVLASPLVGASAVAARTKRIRVGLAVQVLPLANPLRLAEECATLDHLSGGRLVYGIGRSSFVDGYQGYGVNYEDSRPMFFEALEVMRRAWGEEPFTAAAPGPARSPSGPPPRCSPGAGRPSTAPRAAPVLPAGHHGDGSAVARALDDALGGRQGGRRIDGRDLVRAGTPLRAEAPYAARHRSSRHERGRASEERAAGADRSGDN